MGGVQVKRLQAIALGLGVEPFARPVTFATANKLVEQLEALGLLRETTGAQRNRRFRYDPYLALFAERGAAEEPPPTPVQMTESAQQR